jgi:hypothetical protein
VRVKCRIVQEVGLATLISGRSHKTAAALSNFSKTGLTDIETSVPFIRLLVSDGWCMTGQTILTASFMAIRELSLPAMVPGAVSR